MDRVDETGIAGQPGSEITEQAVHHPLDGSGHLVAGTGVEVGHT